MADCDERRAAKILLSLRTGKLTRWPDWIQRPSDAPPEVELPPLPERWPKRPRGPLRARASGWSPSLDGLFARLWQPRSSASSSDEETAHRVRKVNREFLAARRSASGSGLSTSGVERALPRVREKVAAPKDAFMAASSPETPFDYASAARSGASSSGDALVAASSPETPFDYAAAARSGASSSGDEGERLTAKRKARRSGAPSSGDEGCTSPAKRTRVGGDVDAQAAAAAAVKVGVLNNEEENNRDEKGHLLFDLNEDVGMAW